MPSTEATGVQRKCAHFVHRGAGRGAVPDAEGDEQREDVLWRRGFCRAHAGGTLAKWRSFAGRSAVPSRGKAEEECAEATGMVTGGGSRLPKPMRKQVWA